MDLHEYSIISEYQTVSHHRKKTIKVFIANQTDKHVHNQRY